MRVDKPHICKKSNQESAKKYQNIGSNSSAKYNTYLHNEKVQTNVEN